MDGFVLKLLNISLAAGWVALAVILLRLLFRKAPKWIIAAAWALVGLRLLLPFPIASPVSLIPSAEPVRIESSAGESVAVIDSGIPAVDSVINPAIRSAAVPSGAVSEKTGESHSAEKTESGAFSILGTVWFTGMLLMLLYAGVSTLSLRRMTGAAVRTGKDVWISDSVKSPFILGIFRPRIYLPSSTDEKTAEYVIAHERAHLQRKDHWWKPLGWLLLSVYWFHPLLWVAYILLCRDIEFACDEKAVREKDREWTAGYSAALLAASMPRHRVAACPLAFGEVGTKKRIRSLLNYRKPAFWIVIASVLALAAVVVCLLTDPMRQGKDPETGLAPDVKAALEKSIPGQEPGIMAGNDEDSFETSDYIVLGTEEKGNEITVYLWVYYATFVRKDEDPVEFRLSGDGETEQDLHVGKGGAIEVFSSSHIPTAVTLRKVQKGDTEEYVTAEFWEPRDGGYFTEDIQGKFPRSLWGKAFDSQRYVGEQTERCREKALAWFAKGYLTLDEAIRLSEEKGEDLTWGDFEAYRYTVTGSGMYIRLYRMEDDFSVWVSGTTNKPDPGDRPYSIFLFHGDTMLESEEADWVDLRTGDVRAFAEERTGKTPSEGKGSYDYTIYTVSNGYSGAFTVPDGTPSCRPFLLTVIRSETELLASQAYQTAKVKLEDRDAAFADDEWKHGPIRELLADRYTGDFFETHDLLLVCYEVGGGAEFADLTAIRGKGDGIELEFTVFAIYASDEATRIRMMLVEAEKGVFPEDATEPQIVMRTITPEDPHLDEADEALKHHYPYERLVLGDDVIRPRNDEGGVPRGLSALSPLEDWIAGTEPGPDRDKRLAALLDVRSQYVKEKVLVSNDAYGWAVNQLERATITWKGGTVEVDTGMLGYLAAQLGPEKFRAAVASPEIHNASHAEGSMPSEGFQKEEALYSGYSAGENLLIELYSSYNGVKVAVGVFYDPPSTNGQLQLRIGSEGKYDPGSDWVEITPFGGTDLPFPADPSCYLAGPELSELLGKILSQA